MPRSSYPPESLESTVTSGEIAPQRAHLSSWAVVMSHGTIQFMGNGGEHHRLMGV
jgi:hypothetical protein